MAGGNRGAAEGQTETVGLRKAGGMRGAAEADCIAGGSCICTE